jgi:hypothetical protein
MDGAVSWLVWAIAQPNLKKKKEKKKERKKGLI